MTTQYSLDQINDILAYTDACFGDPDGESNDWIVHEIQSEYIHTDVKIYNADEQRRTFVTCGMSARNMSSPDEMPCRTELVMHASPQLDNTKDGLLAAKELTRMSKFPFRNDTWFGEGHTINLSPAFHERFGFDAVVFADILDPYELNGVGEVRFLNIVPIYNEELEWIKKNNPFTFLDILYMHVGDTMFNIDSRREPLIPDVDETEWDLMRSLNITKNALLRLKEYLEKLEKCGEDIDYDRIGEWISQHGEPLEPEE